MRKAKKEILERRKKLLAILIFLIKLNLFVIPLYVLLWLDFSLPSLQNFLASSLASTLSFFKYPAVSKGKYIFIFLSEDSYRIIPFEISMDCTGWKSMYLMVALAFSTSFNLRRNFKFLAIALPLLFSLNFLRIFSTLIIAFKLGSQYFEVIHTFLWRECMVAAVILIWYFWLRKIKYSLKDNLILVEKLGLGK